METKTQTLANYVPSDYEDLFRHYFPSVKRWVAANRIDPQNVEDVSMTLLAKFVERSSLEKYSADAEFTHQGVVRNAKFSTYLSGFVYAYIRHYVHRERLTKHREAVVLDASLPSSNYQGDSTYRDVLLSPVVETYENMYAEDTTRQIREHLLSLPSTRGADLVLLFDLVCTQVAEEGTIVVKDLAALFDVHQNTIRNWIVALRSEVSAALGSR